MNKFSDNVIRNWVDDHINRIIERCNFRSSICLLLLQNYYEIICLRTNRFRWVNKLTFCTYCLKILSIQIANFYWNWSEWRKRSSPHKQTGSNDLLQILVWDPRAIRNFHWKWKYMSLAGSQVELPCSYYHQFPGKGFARTVVSTIGSVFFNSPEKVPYISLRNFKISHYLHTDMIPIQKK